jgi:hypothetical protein
MDRPNAGSRDITRANAGSRDLNRPSGATRDLNRPNAGTREFSRPNAGTRDLGTVNRGTRDFNADGNRNINRDLNRPNAGTRDFNADRDRNINRDVTRNIDRNVDINPNWDRRVDLNNVNVRPGWARPGWGVARPWNYGWYGGWSTPTWGWWGARAAAWGVGTLATAAIINDAVNNAVDNNTTYIVVPNSNYQLLFGSVQPSGTSAISFAVTDGGSTYQLTADCQSGLLSGQEPQSAAEAELLNAACQVAFGNA